MPHLGNKVSKHKNKSKKKKYLQNIINLDRHYLNNNQINVSTVINESVTSIPDTPLNSSLNVRSLTGKMSKTNPVTPSHMVSRKKSVPKEMYNEEIMMNENDIFYYEDLGDMLSIDQFVSDIIMHANDYKLIDGLRVIHIMFYFYTYDLFNTYDIITRFQTEKHIEDFLKPLIEGNLIYQKEIDEFVKQLKILLRYKSKLKKKFEEKRNSLEIDQYYKIIDVDYLFNTIIFDNNSDSILEYLKLFKETKNLDMSKMTIRQFYLFF